MTTSTIFMVRHAVSPFVVGKERERGLSFQGVEEASRVMDVLHDENIEHFISSPYQRAIDTLRPLADSMGKDIHIYEELKERAIARTDVEMEEQIILQGIRESFADKDYKMTGGESTREVQTRSIPVILRLLQQYAGCKIAIGTHGNIMTAILNYFDANYGYEFFVQTSKPDIYKLEFEGLQMQHVSRMWPVPTLSYDH